MKRSRLREHLSTLAGFETPRAHLEQYPTPPGVAASLVHLADSQGDLSDRVVLDLGTGTGMLALGAALRGSNATIGLDLDPDALSIARENESRLGSANTVEWINADATRVPITADRAGTPRTVLMNPPFGARSGNEHADRAFLETAAYVATVSYSIHNAGSEGFVESFVADNGGRIERAYRIELALENSFAFHTSDRETIEAELYRIVWSN